MLFLNSYLKILLTCRIYLSTCVWGLIGVAGLVFASLSLPLANSFMFFTMFIMINDLTIIRYDIIV